MNGHVGKPFNLNELVNTLLKLSNNVTVFSDTDRETKQELTIALIEESESLLRRFGNKPSILKKVLVQFEPEMNGLLADFDTQLEQQNSVALAAILHTIKGTSASLGARYLSQFAANLEAQLKQKDPSESLAVMALQRDKLQELLQESVEALNHLMSTLSLEVDFDKHNDDHDDDWWQSQFSDIYPLLHAHNLRAIDLVEALPSQGLYSNNPVYQRFIEQVQALDFTVAEVSLKTLMAASDNK